MQIFIFCHPEENSLISFFKTVFILQKGQESSLQDDNNFLLCYGMIAPDILHFRNILIAEIIYIYCRFILSMEKLAQIFHNFVKN